MTCGLNFNRSRFVVFSAFVSFWIILATQSTTSGEEASRNASSTADAIKSAKALIEKGNADKATALLWKYVDKLDRESLLLLARAHEKGKEPEEMTRALEIVLSKNPKDVEALTLTGQALFMRKKNKEAMEHLKNALEINSKYEPAYQALIDYYEKRTPPNLYELRILFQDMIESIGPRHQYLLKLCEIDAMDSTYEPAIQSCKSAIAKNAKNPDAYVYLGLSYRATGEDNKGVKTLKKAATDFQNSELAQYSYAKVLEENKNFVEAMMYYKAGTAAHEKSARSWLGLATTSFEIKKFEISLIAFKKACQLDKKNAAAFRRAAATLRNSKNFEWSDKFVSAAEQCTF